MTLAGALLPLLLGDLHLGLMDAGSMLALQPVGFLVAVSTARRWIHRFGLVSVIVGGVVLAASGFAMFAGAGAWLTGALSMLVAGVGVGLAEVTMNAALLLVAGGNSNRVLNFVHLFFGVGSFLTPMLAIGAIELGWSWRAAFLAMALPTAGIGVAWALVPLRTHAEVANPTSAALEEQRQVGSVLWLALMLGLYVGVEMGVGGWLSKFLVSVHAMPLATAGNILSAYWFALAAGRLLLSVLPLREAAIVEEQRLLALSAIATAALVVATTADQMWLSAVSFCLTGLGFSGIFPGVVALGGRYQPDAVASATSTLITGAGLGNILIPWAMSAVADNAGLRAGMYLYAAMSAAMLAIAGTVWQQARQRTRGAT